MIKINVIYSFSKYSAQIRKHNIKLNPKMQLRYFILFGNLWHLNAFMQFINNSTTQQFEM